jgi:hypothetical protein
MPPLDERNGPHASTGRRQITITPLHTVQAAAVARSYSRRRAALRLAPFGGGPTDPLDELAQLPIRAAEPCCGAEYSQGGWRPCCRGGAA